MSVVIVKDIEKNDIAYIKQLLKEAVGSDEYTNLERLGGLTNHTYRAVTSDGKEYAIRIPGEGTEEVINRADEKVSTELACELGIDAELLLFDDKGAKVSKYIKDALTLDEKAMQENARIEKCANIFRKLHNCGKDTKVDFEVFTMAHTYEDFIYSNNVSLFNDYQYRKKQVQDIKKEVEATGSMNRVPCHNDPLCANWVESGDRIYLIDWEYAGMNDGMWDIAATSIEACFKQKQDLLFLEKYLQHEPNNDEIKHLLASKIFVDYLWTLWAKMRVPFDGQPMEDWATERYERMIGFIEEYRNI